MNKLLLTIVALLAISGSRAGGLTDITSQYLTNTSFENDNISVLPKKTVDADGLRGYTVSNPTDWTVSGYDVSLIVTKDCFTDNNFGKVTSLADGTQAYYLRTGWSTGTTTMRQTISRLPKGKYRLTVAVRSGYANNATSTLKLVAGSGSASVPFIQGSEGCFTTMAWTTQKLDFTQPSDGNLDVGFDVSWQSGGSCVMLDDIHLYAVPDDYEEPLVEVTSPTEGTVLSDFVAEPQMKADLLKMLANFATYLKNDFYDCQAPNNQGETCGYFNGESSGQNNEAGVRTNADLSMICAFLVKYGKGKVTLPSEVTWERIEEMAMKSLVFAYSTHKANKLKGCAPNGTTYWGSTSTSDCVWESSLWAMSVAYSAFFQWDKLTEAQRGYVYNLLKAECNYELNRSIPTGYAGDTKAEENGWEADVLAVTLGLFPNDPLAPQWFQRLREFAINSYSQKDDATDQTVIDPDYDNKTVADLYKGQNLYDDYTLQNHNYFHTSYQNVVIQELGEAALALKLFQQGLYGEEKWKTNALMHNNDRVMRDVLYWLALADGELAMPNGNDWSLFLYDQITSYSTNACFLSDPDALMLENLAYKMIKARQTTTNDGSWLLRPDVGARRMGVEAHRVMMTWLMHEALSTANLTPTNWTDFNRTYESAKVFSSQNIVRAATDSRFTCFSWSKGLQSYTGYIAANSVDKNKIIVPFRANNTGNFLGWYDVQGKKTNATPVVSGNYQLNGNSYVMNGELNTNDAALNNRFAIYSTPGNAVVYIDYVRANADVTITAEKGGLMAISTDELTKTLRTLHTANGTRQLDGIAFTTMGGQWVNIDDQMGIVATGTKEIAFGDRTNNNSIMTARLYSSYSDESRAVKKGDVVDCRLITYYSGVDAKTTATLAQRNQKIETPEGWSGAIVFDPDQTGYLVLSNFASNKPCPYPRVMTKMGYPVLSISSDTSFNAKQNHSVVNVLRFFVDDQTLITVQAKDDPNTVYLLPTAKCECDYTIRAVTADGVKEKTFRTAGRIKASIVGGELLVEEAGGFPEPPKEDDVKTAAKQLLGLTLSDDERDDLDVNCDGSIDIIDIVTIISLICNMNNQ